MSEPQRAPAPHDGAHAGARHVPSSQTREAQSRSRSHANPSEQREPQRTSHPVRVGCDGSVTEMLQVRSSRGSTTVIAPAWDA